MRAFLEISRTGVVSMLLHPLRSVATVACLMAGLLPYLVGVGMSHGVQQQASDSIRWGADMYVSGLEFGRPVPLSLATGERIRGITGVLGVRPRIVGAITLGKDRNDAVVVGLPTIALPKSARCVQGRLFRKGAHELVVGSALARELNLKVGSLLPPFYRNVEGERVTRVVGIFESDSPLWQAAIIFTSLETAAMIFDQRGKVTEFLVNCRPGYQQHVARAISRLSEGSGEDRSRLGLRVVTRQQLRAIVPGGLLHREGIFNLHFVLVFSVGILAILATSGFGSAERRREIGVLKATGWRTDEVLLRGTVEAVLLSILGASLSILAAFAWLEWFNGYWVASLFLPSIASTSGVDVPFRLLPLPALLGFLIALALVLSGTLYSSWRAAIVPPIEALR